MDTNKPQNEAALRRMIERYVSGKTNPEENAFLEKYFEYFENEPNITEELTEEERQSLGEKMQTAILQKIGAPVRKIQYRRIAVAAAIAGLIITGAIYLTRPPGKPDQTIASDSTVSDLEPGGNKAFLITADGKRISLDDASVGEVSREDGTIIQKTRDGQLVYDLSGLNVDASTSAINTIETPVGGEYQVILSDGTKVWLNASSSLEFPAAFKGKERLVKLSGEGYFEVARNAKMPFQVQVNDMKVNVLGTHFNIMAYGDEGDIKTTLLEGSVNVSNALSSKILTPGQQARVGTTDDIDVKTVDVEDAVAWKNGYFSFKEDRIETVLRQLSRWYDMQVVYEGKIPSDRFTGKIRRNAKASKVLQFMEEAGVNFRVDGRKVIVLNK